MNETDLHSDQSGNYLFAFLGGICAVVVGIAFFGESSSRAPASFNPEQAAVVILQDSMTELPILE